MGWFSDDSEQAQSYEQVSTYLNNLPLSFIIYLIATDRNAFSTTITPLTRLQSPTSLSVLLLRMR